RDRARRIGLRRRRSKGRRKERRDPCGEQAGSPAHGGSSQCFLCQVFLCQVFLCQVFLCQVFLCQVFLCQVFLCQVFLCQVFLCEVFLSQVFMPQAFRPRAVSAAARLVAHPRILRHLCNRTTDGLGVKRPALRMATST